MRPFNHASCKYKLGKFNFTVMQEMLRGPGIAKDKAGGRKGSADSVRTPGAAPHAEVSRRGKVAARGTQGCWAVWKDSFSWGTSTLRDHAALMERKQGARKAGREGGET